MTSPPGFPTLILANGPLPTSAAAGRMLPLSGEVIAADGGANHCEELQITPHHLIGDLDSIDPAILARYSKSGVHISRHPRAKDATDLELAIDLAISQGATEILLAGVLGGRWDMSLANIMLAGQAKYAHIPISLLSDDALLTPLAPETLHHFKNCKDLTCSFIPLSGEVTGVTLNGFAYPLHEETLPFGTSRGVSNIIAANQATEQHSSGLLLGIRSLIKQP